MESGWILAQNGIRERERDRERVFIQERQRPLRADGLPSLGFKNEKKYDERSAWMALRALRWAQEAKWIYHTKIQTVNNGFNQQAATNVWSIREVY